MAHLYTTTRTALKFKWLGSGTIPDAFDLRQYGWSIEEDESLSNGCIGMICTGESESVDWELLLSIPDQLRRFVIVVGTSTTQECTRLLQAGFGEVVTDTIEASEYVMRANRLAELTRWLPRYRLVGALELDLLAREAFGNGKALNLNPREFSLIWRLADRPGEVVSKQDLIQDVWRMGFVPETNSIAVHMSRLRRKLSFVELSGIISTASNGGYRLNLPREKIQETTQKLIAA